MSPKEKAQELFNKLIYGNDVAVAKSKVLAVADEIINTGTLKPIECGFLVLTEKHLEFWSKVKEEIKTL